MATKVVHCKMEPYDVYIGRPSPWGNPFKAVAYGRDGCIQAYREWVLTSQDPGAQWIRAHVHELKGKTLGCWCSPMACHGDILAAMADSA